MIPAHPPRATAANAIAFTYRDRLHPWHIMQQLPNLQHTIVARFRHRNHAEAYLRQLQRSQPNQRYEIVFNASMKC